MEVMEYKKTYREYEAEIDGEFQQAAERFVKIGYLLKVARDTDILKESGYRDVHEFAKRRYGLDKSQVSRFTRINDRFSMGGNSDQLQDHYKGFGNSKLAIMLQLPDALNEELTPAFSKEEITAIKEEVEEERKITEIEVMTEQEPEVTAAVEGDLLKMVRKLGEEEPDLYKTIWHAARGQGWGEQLLQEIMAPSGQKLYSVRIPGIGRKQLLVKDQENGGSVILIDIRSNGKLGYAWGELMDAWISVVSGETGSAEAAWESLYKQEFSRKEEVAPVQLADKRKESKVTKAKTEPPVVKPAPGKETEDTYKPLPGQMTLTGEHPQSEMGKVIENIEIQAFGQAVEPVQQESGLAAEVQDAEYREATETEESEYTRVEIDNAIGYFETEYNRMAGMGIQSTKSRNYKMALDAIRKVYRS